MSEYISVRHIPEVAAAAAAFRAAEDAGDAAVVAFLAPYRQKIADAEVAHGTDSLEAWEARQAFDRAWDVAQKNYEATIAPTSHALDIATKRAQAAVLMARAEG